MRRFLRSAPVLALSVLAALVAARAQDPARFESEVKALEGALAGRALPKGPLVFAGSSSFRLWKSLAADLEGYAVVNLGFGGSQMSDLNHFAPRLVEPLRPRIAFVYEGDNDLADGKSPGTVLNDYKVFVARLHKTLPETRIAYVAVKPSPSRRKLLDAQRELNRLVKEYSATDPRLDFIDVFTPMLDSKGEPRAELFGPDRLHLNDAGYALWTRLVRGYLEGKPWTKR